MFPDADNPFRISFCPAKVVAVNMRKLTVVSRYQFPESVVPAETNTLNDIFLTMSRVNLLLSIKRIPAPRPLSFMMSKTISHSA